MSAPTASPLFTREMLADLRRRFGAKAVADYLGGLSTADLLIVLRPTDPEGLFLSRIRRPRLIDLALRRASSAAEPRP